ncbi:hypothetical protein TWF481_010827 [Arthrobotrys musiformis]|uniref:Uncharacterized protein n=1 Tax=Arthrobotrys musiformis TaxID=47236 RepID=A0AAV9W4M4_9PEZI
MGWTNDHAEVLQALADSMAVPYGDVAGSWVTEPVPAILSEPYLFPEGWEGEYDFARHEFGYYGPRYGPGPVPGSGSGSGSGGGGVGLRRRSIGAEGPTCGVDEGSKHSSSREEASPGGETPTPTRECTLE